jgi:hypothetical protein
MTGARGAARAPLDASAPRPASCRPMPAPEPACATEAGALADGALAEQVGEAARIERMLSSVTARVMSPRNVTTPVFFRCESAQKGPPPLMVVFGSL